jgi:hypothetical protein
LESCPPANLTAVAHAYGALQLPQALQFEPMKLCGPSVTTLPAGSSLPESSISVRNGSGAKVVKALIAGKRQHLEVVSVTS